MTRLKTAEKAAILRAMAIVIALGVVGWLAVVWLVAMGGDPITPYVMRLAAIPGVAGILYFAVSAPLEMAWRHRHG